MPAIYYVTKPTFSALSVSAAASYIGVGKTDNVMRSMVDGAVISMIPNSSPPLRWQRTLIIDATRVITVVCVVYIDTLLLHTVQACIRQLVGLITTDKDRSAITSAGAEITQYA